MRVKRALPPTKSLVHNVAIEVGCDVHPIVKLEFRESDVSPSNTEVKQRKIVEFISPGNLVIIFCQLTMYGAAIYNTFRDILITRF